MYLFVRILCLAHSHFVRITFQKSECWCEISLFFTILSFFFTVMVLTHHISYVEHIFHSHKKHILVLFLLSSIRINSFIRAQYQVHMIKRTMITKYIYCLTVFHVRIALSVINIYYTLDEQWHQSAYFFPHYSSELYRQNAFFWLHIQIEFCMKKAIANNLRTPRHFVMDFLKYI